MSNVTLEDIKVFAVEQLWPLRDPISDRTALAHEFGIAGLDGKEFMEDFSSRFGVDLGDFAWLEYFGAEGVNPLGLPVYLYKRFVRGIPNREHVDLPEITLGHLLKCANRGKWETPG